MSEPIIERGPKDMSDDNVTPIQKLSHDLRIAARTLEPSEARYLVDAYYVVQDYRKRADNQVRAADEAEEPHEVIGWHAAQTRTWENQIRAALDSYSHAQELGQWARSILGIGPVIAAGLLAHIDLNKAPTVGHIWRFAGLDPTVKWEKKQKRPWNADLKVLCWKIGESFVKVSGKPDAYYGQIYVERKAGEIVRNQAGDFADQATAALEAKRYGKETEARKHYEAGHLPPAHIHARAKRYAVKLFLAHYHEKGCELLGLPVPLPYPIAHGDHVHRSSYRDAS